MAGKKQTPDPPDWYRPEAYLCAEDIDAGDWLLNLALRGWLHREPQAQTEAALRAVGPVLRRRDDSQMVRMHEADLHQWVYTFNWGEGSRALAAHHEALARPLMASDVREAFRTGRVGSGVEPLSVGGLYLFEKMLPEDVRAEGRRMQQHGPSRASSPAFNGSLDDAFPSQMVSRFVRINLSLPDDVLRADLDEFLASKRQRLAALGGPQPYREAARLKLKAHELRTLANVGLLQFLDLDRWQTLESLNLSFYSVREMAGVADRSREAELKRRVKLTVEQLQLHAWFARLERGGGRTRPRRS